MSHRVGPDTIKLMFWNCSSCERKGIRGDVDRCPNCGSAKEADEHYLHFENAPVVTDPEGLHKALAGPNRTCRYCTADIRADEDICPECAARRHEEDDDGGIPERITTTETLGNDTGEPATSTEPKSAAANATPVPVTSPHVVQKLPEPEPTHLPEAYWKNDEPEVSLPRHRINFKVMLGVIGGAIVLSGLIWLLVWLFVPWETTASVSSVRWSYTVDLQQKTLRHDEGWDETVPAGAFNQHSERRQRGTEQCRPHDCNQRTESYRCNPHNCGCHEVCRDLGNGSESCHQECDTCYDTCSRQVHDTCYDQCPVYDQWVSYDYYDWPTINSATTSGDDLNVYAPTLQAISPDQRLRHRTSFTVRFTADQTSYTLNPNLLSEYQRYSIGSRWQVKVNRAGQIWPLKRLQ